MPTRPTGPRIALIHALAESIQPIHEAFRSEWPEAVHFDVLDTSLARDLAAAGSLLEPMRERFLTLARYAAETSGEGGDTAGILFTCSAFGPAIDGCKAAARLPVLRPNEAAFDAALQRGGRVGLLVTFQPSLAALESELMRMADESGVLIDLTAHVVVGALSALQAGDSAEHDRRIAAAAAQFMGDVDTLVLGQFSMARAAASIEPVAGRDVLTTPSSAVRLLRSLLSDIRGSC